MKVFLCLVALVALLGSSFTAAARPVGGHPGGGQHMGGAQFQGAGQRQPVPSNRGGAGGGFNFNHDITPSNSNRGGLNHGGNGGNFNGNHGNFNGNNGNHSHNNFNGGNGNGNHGNFSGNHSGNTINNHSGNTININNQHTNTVVRNPVYYGGPAWGWNHGVVWAPAGGYWGGGFWGAMAVGVTSAIVFGSIVNAGRTYPSYQVQPSSPGATLLANYHLTQTQCGPPNLVVMYGPDNSVICAYPNNAVSAGNYNIDTSTLSLTSQ